MGQSAIVRVAIHPGIGIARVGNSQGNDPDSYFIGPELPHVVEAPAGGHKDASGAMKRQAARFRIYGYDAAGNAVREIAATDADVEEIRWTVHVANKKAAWYNFDLALDIPEAASVVSARRNPQLQGSDRRRLEIDPGARAISGIRQSGQVFDTGQFLGQAVYLGELLTDEAGNLVFLGGRGVSSTPIPNNTLYTFANNDGWHDDVSDGPVRATVKFRNGQALEADPAWVVTAPPNFAPDIISIQTMYDVMYDAFARWWLKAPAKPSFTEHIFPILREFCANQWVNFGFFVQFGWGAPYEFLRPDLLQRLASNRAEYQELRRQIFNEFRDPTYATPQPQAWPQVYGDNMDLPASDARQFLALTATQYNFLKQWVAGEFDADWDPARKLPQHIEDVPLAQRPATLDRAALTFCMGGPFHPGCEMTWPMRHYTMYYAPFRIRPRAATEPAPDYGDSMTQAIINSSNGPLYANGPGDLTRWMAVPWQTDTASCRAGYETAYEPYLPTFWPARVPNHVLAAEEYSKVTDTSLPLDARMLAFNTRSVWYRGLRGSYLDQIAQMVSDFGKLGVLERRPGPGDGQFPSEMYVETLGLGTGTPRERNLYLGPVGKRAPRIRKTAGS